MVRKRLVVFSTLMVALIVSAIVAAKVMHDGFELSDAQAMAEAMDSSEVVPPA